MALTTVTKGVSLSPRRAWHLMFHRALLVNCRDRMSREDRQPAHRRAVALRTRAAAETVWRSPRAPPSRKPPLRAIAPTRPARDWRAAPRRAYSQVPESH